MTRLVPTLREKKYGFSKIRLTTLETRRIRGDLIEFYKIINGSDQVKWKNMPKKMVQGEMDGPAARNLEGRIYVIAESPRIYVRSGTSSFRTELSFFGTNYHKKLENQ